MIHARPDYQRIQDPAGLIPPDEPVFLLRAQDVTAPDAVEQWARLQYSAKGNRDLAALAMVHADAMRIWQGQNPDRVKVADGPHPAATDGGALSDNDPQRALARRLLALSGRAAGAAYPEESSTPTWQDIGERTRQFYHELAGMLLRGES